MMTKEIKSNKYIVHECSFCERGSKTKKEAEQCYDSHCNHICVSCHTPIKQIGGGNLNNATEFKLECGWGSIHDGTMYNLALCDKCLSDYVDAQKERKVKILTTSLFTGEKNYR